ncbi:DUF2188 domain-containing protein [Paenalkalicoccus suaedae]|uniref:DUF2188 domain-containing protein n=1 Tax=Paenalkalicoccus suaedae TaxID=2592382 RepID=A0A859FD12_9BACI|nr:DUF2188 domain-containing protein [Paenalkalicoccus suaedae]QKS70106.1 DUF2188 domain-containing protein [Paenalkalicoccus suaedae]
MPWSMNNYPSSWKNLKDLVRKKAIDIGNAMLTDGYKEEDVIPIATEQAKKWYEDASKEEKQELENKSTQDLTSHSKNSSSNPELNEKGVHVVSHDSGWAVRSSDASRASGIFDKKNEAIERAKEIAKNKGTSVVIHKRDGSIQQSYSY